MIAATLEVADSDGNRRRHLASLDCDSAASRVSSEASSSVSASEFSTVSSALLVGVRGLFIGCLGGLGLGQGFTPQPGGAGAGARRGG